MLIGFILSCVNFIVFLTVPEQADVWIEKLYVASGVSNWRWTANQFAYAQQTQGFAAFLLLINCQFLGAIGLIIFMLARRLVSLAFQSVEISIERKRIFLLLITLVVLGSFLGPLNANILQDNDPRITSMPTNVIVFVIAVAWWAIFFMAKVNALEPRLANATLLNSSVDW